MAYTQNEKSTGLDSLNPPISTSLFIMGDPADAGRAKKSTLAQVSLAILTYIQASLGGLVQSVTGLNTDNSDPKNPVIQISVDGTTITGDGTPGNPLVATGGSGGSGSGFDGKTKSYSLEGLEGTPIQNGYQNIEAYLTSSGTTLYAEINPNFLQVRDVVSDWASATQINSYVINQGFLFLLLQDTAVNAYRVYRYDINDLSLGGTLMTIATQTLGTQDLVMMTSDGTNFYFNYQAGNSTNDFDISKYTISGTTLTWSSDIACGAIANATNVFIVKASGDIYGLNINGTREVKQFNNTGTLQNTYGPYDTNYTNIINWTGSIYIVKSTGDDEAYRITELTSSGSSGFGNGFQMFFRDYISGTGGNLSAQQIWKFGNYVFARFAGVGGGGETNYLAFTFDATTGSPYQIALPYAPAFASAGTGVTMFVNDSQSKMYIAYSKSGTPTTMVVDEFDTSFNRTTYTYDPGVGTATVPSKTFFVNGSDVYIYYDIAGIVFAQDTYQFTIVGANLTAPAACSFADIAQSAFDGTNLWTLDGVTFDKWTVAGTVITSVPTTFPEYSTNGQMILPSGFGASYGLQIINGLWSTWQPSGGHSTGADTVGETTMATLRQYTKP